MDANKDLVVYEARDGQEIKLSFATIKKYLVQGHPEYVTDQEMVYYMGICKSRGINPFNKDCYLMKYSQKDNAALIVSIDYKRKLARIQEDCQGWEAGIIIERKGEIIYSNGLILEGDKLLGGWFEAQPEGFSKPRRHEVNLAAYIKKTSTGEITAFWKKEKQPMMIAKVAESQGLNMIWPGEFAKLYTPEEMGEADMFKSTENAASDKIKGKGKATPQTQAKEDIYEAKAASESEKKEEEPKKTKGRKKKEDPKEGEKAKEKTDLIRATYWDLPQPKFTPYCKNNHGAIGQLPKKYQTEIHAKWKGFHPGVPFPGSEQSEPTSGLPGGPVGDPDPETDDEKFMRLVDGAEENVSGLALECPETDKGIRVLKAKCEGNCNSREGCPSWTKYDKE